MSYNWSPHYIVPSEALKSYSGAILLREGYDALLSKALAKLGFAGRVIGVNNPSYYRQKNS